MCVLDFFHLVVFFEVQNKREKTGRERFFKKKVMREGIKDKSNKASNPLLEYQGASKKAKKSAKIEMSLK